MLLSAAMIDDVIGLIMASVVGQVTQSDKEHSTGLAWTILKPVVASIGITLLTPAISRFILAPIYCKVFKRLSDRRRKFRAGLLVALVTILSALLAISDYTGTSMLFGAYVAGCVLCYLDSSAKALREDEGDQDLTFERVFAEYIAPSNERIFVPMFFATIGAAIPFVPLFRPTILWKGILYSGLMFVCKFVTGICIVFWEALPRVNRVGFRRRNPGKKAIETTIEKPSAVAKKDLAEDSGGQHDDSNTAPTHLQVSTPSLSLRWQVYPALLIAFAMVSRGEIALIIAQIGRSTLGDDGFLVVIWAVVICTLLGPLLTGLLVRFHADELGGGVWGGDSIHDDSIGI